MQKSSYSEMAFFTSELAFRLQMNWIVGGAAPGGEWRGVARNEPMSGLLFFNNFYKFQNSKRINLQQTSFEKLLI